MMHSQGEWVAMKRTGTGIFKIVSDTLQEICETQMPYGNYLSRSEVFKEGEANAKLIAAAPDLLNACFNAMGICDLSNDTHKYVFKQLEAAFNKAKGNGNSMYDVSDK